LKKFSLIMLVALTVAACSRPDSLEIPTGSDVKVEKTDGVTVSGTLLEVRPEHVVLETRVGERTTVQRADIKTIAAAPAPADTPAVTPPVADVARAVDATGTPAAPVTRRPVDRTPEYREITLPAGTVLPVALQTALASDTSSAEDAVRGTLRRAVTLEGLDVLPAGTAVSGHVTSVARSAKVKGRGSVAFRFNQIDLPGDGGRSAMTTATITRVAPATKKKDAAKIGGGAAGGAIIGGLIGGGDGAAKGAAIGGAAGTGVVLATRGEEVRLGPGLAVSVRLTSPLTVRVPLER
jgi:hypothetical protein